MSFSLNLISSESHCNSWGRDKSKESTPIMDLGSTTCPFVPSLKFASIWSIICLPDKPHIINMQSRRTV